jgi:cell division protein FtsZ
MSDNAYNFEIPKHHKSIIKVIGIGGGGSNAVNHMYNLGIKDVEFVVCNTDAQALHSSPVPNKLQIGMHLTDGLGAGANPEKGRDAALESKDDIRDLLSDDTKMLFVTAGMGGGTGTGAAPVIAQIARDLDILTVGIITVPFGFEGRKKMEQADAGIKALKESCDTVLIILNDKLREIYGNLPISEAFAKADNVLTTAAKGIAEIITVPGYVNVDFEDVKTVMVNAGAAVMGSGTVEGDGRARRAAEAALVSPLLNSKDIHGAKKILLSIISGEEAELQMDELSDITEYIQEMTGDEAEVIFGHGVDDNLGENIRVTVIATGFEIAKFNKRRSFSNRSDEKVIYDLDKDATPDINEQPEEINESLSASLEPELKEQPTAEVPDNEFENGYFFISPNEAEKDSEDIFGVDEVVVTDDLAGLDQLNELDNMSLKNKREMLDMRRRERVSKLSGVKSSELKSDKDIKSKLDQPAFTRRNVHLEDVPHSSERHISKFNLNDDNQILGNNKFLHDNVD